MRREQGCKQYLVTKGRRCMKHMMGGAFQRPYRHAMPIFISRNIILESPLGIRGMGTSLLLSEASSPNSNVIGTGFGVKAPGKNLLNKLDNLNVGKKRKNVNIGF